jgi:hypothetical protein
VDITQSGEDHFGWLYFFCVVPLSVHVAGDFGHGLLMFAFAMYLLGNEQKFMRQQLDEIFGMAFGGRYCIALMASFSIFTGLIYNEFFSMPMTLFGGTRMRVSGTLAAGHTLLCSIYAVKFVLQILSQGGLMPSAHVSALWKAAAWVAFQRTHFMVTDAQCVHLLVGCSVLWMARYVTTSRTCGPARRWAAQSCSRQTLGPTPSVWTPTGTVPRCGQWP